MHVNIVVTRLCTLQNANPINGNKESRPKNYACKMLKSQTRQCPLLSVFVYSPPEKVVLSLVSFRLHVRHQSLSSNSTAFSLCLPPLGFLNSHENVWRGDTAHLAFSPGPCDPPTVFDDATACNNSECQKAVGCISRPQLLVRVGDIVEADSCTQTLPCMHMNSAANTHKHTLACMHAHRTLFKEVCFFLLLPFPFSGLPTFPECPGCAAKEPCLLCARDSPNPALFCPDSWFSLSLSLFNIHSKSPGSHKTAVFPVFSPANSQVWPL